MVRTRRLLALIVLWGCSDAGPSTPIVEVLPAEFSASLSEAVVTPPAISPTGLTGRRAYVSMSPGTVSNGVRLEIWNRQTGTFASYPIVDGGLDPVAVSARAGDTLDLTAVTKATPLHSSIVVAASRRPRVVRTSPTRGKRGVPLNSSVVVVFSEPIDASVLTSGAVRLVDGTEPVPSALDFTGAEHLAVSISPHAALAGDHEYTVVVSTDVRDLAGEQLDVAVQSNFFTEPAPIVTSAPSGAFVEVGAMIVGRYGHTSTLLPDGKVLIAGGAGRSAELYDPTTKTFTLTGTMRESRTMHRAVALQDGRVLLVGGWNAVNAETYDPATGAFTATGKPLTQQIVMSATLLANGKVLVGGVEKAELFDPSSGTFTLAGAYAVVNPQWPEYWYEATLLDDGRVLFTGMPDRAQIYDPATNAFTAVGNLNMDGLELHTATLLGNGKVLVAGGGNDEYGGRTELAELYDPIGGLFTRTASMRANRAAHAAVRLSDGKALILGGDTNTDGHFGGSLSSAEIYDPTLGTFALAGDMHVARTGMRATLLKNGDVLVTGGYRYCSAGCMLGPTDVAEVFQRSVAAPVVR